MKAIGMIPARYKSSRFPGKPLAPILGKSLIQHTYENAKKCPALSEVIVATDDHRIFDHVIGFQGEAIMTSPECANGSDRLQEVLQNNHRFQEFDIVVNVQGDEPVLDPHTITLLVDALRHDPNAVVATPIVKMRSQEDFLNPSIAKCVKDQNNYALYFSRAPIPGSRSHDPISFFRHIGIYAYRREFLLTYATLPATPLQLIEDLEQLKVIEHGYKIKVVEVDSISIEVNHPEDIHKVESYLCKQNLSS